MPTPPASDSPDDRPALEPIRVLRPRRTDALAQLLEEIRQDKDYRGQGAAASAPVAQGHAGEDTEPLPPVPGGGTRQLSPARAGRTEQHGPARGGKKHQHRPARGGETKQLPPTRGGKTQELPASAGDAHPPRPVDRPRLGPGQRRAAVVIAIAAAAVVGFGCSLLIPGRTEATPAAPSVNAPAAPASPAPGPAGVSDVLTNSGFESGTLSPWKCPGNPGSVVSSPVKGGSKALQGKVSPTDIGQCAQTVAVRPDTTYSLSGWVRGSNVYLGVDGGASTWTTSPSAFSALTVSFTTGASQTSATVYVHGWYAQGGYYADDIALAPASATPAR